MAARIAPRRSAAAGPRRGARAALVPVRASIEVGTLAKSFTLPSSKGGKTKFPAKKASVVFFFQKSDTPGCSAEANSFDELAGEFSKRGVQLVGVSMEEVEALKASNAGRKGVELLSDADGAVSEYFGAELKLPLIGTKLGFSSRETFLLSSKGEVLAKWAEGKNMKSVKSTAHAEQVLEAVDENVDAGFSLASIFG